MKFDALKPQKVDDALIAFPAKVLDMMPRFEDIPEEFTQPTNPWVQFAERWFYDGANVLVLNAKPGIDKMEALRHLVCVIRSYEPKQEHKIASVAFLLSCWFEPVDTTAGTE